MEQDTFQNIHKAYSPISLHSLRINTVTNFDIYIRHITIDSEEVYVLYRKRNISFTDRVRRNLTEHGIEQLYIDVSDRKEYQVYIEKNLDAIIADESIPVEEKSSITYTCATGLVEDLLENPRSGEHIQRSNEVI